MRRVTYLCKASEPGIQRGSVLARGTPWRGQVWGLSCLPQVYICFDRARRRMDERRSSERPGHGPDIGLNRAMSTYSNGGTIVGIRG
jgi:hypothetical protein